VTDAAEVVSRLAAQGTWSYSRASGPGGQHRDHAETRAELVIDEAALAGLPDAIAERLRDRLGVARAPLRLTSQQERSRERNRRLVIEELRRRVERALAPPPPPRRPTRPSRSATERRLEEKTRRSRAKADRRPPTEDA
jgi:ribosome-associated protein